MASCPTVDRIADWPEGQSSVSCSVERGKKIAVEYGYVLLKPAQGSGTCSYWFVNGCPAVSAGTFPKVEEQLVNSVTNVLPRFPRLETSVAEARRVVYISMDVP
jgi:hypothetical protein